MIDSALIFSACFHLFLIKKVEFVYIENTIPQKGVLSTKQRKSQTKLHTPTLT